MENLTSAVQSGKAGSASPDPKSPEFLHSPLSAEGTQGRPRWELVRELRHVASLTSEDFWIWWFMLPKGERRVLLDAMAEGPAKPEQTGK